MNRVQQEIVIHVYHQILIQMCCYVSVERSLLVLGTV